MEAGTLDRHIETTPGIAGGKPRIAGRRLTVQDVAFWHEHLGRSADEIAEEHDLTLAEIYTALAYYFEHRTEIDQHLEEDRTFLRQLRQRTPSKVRQRLGEFRSDVEDQLLHR
jgi:uncharacterized protein (DUF433 family)